MTGKTFFNRATRGGEDILARLSSVLEETHSAYCVIGGSAVNGYAEPVVSLDLAVITEKAGVLCAVVVARGMNVQEFGHNLNLSAPASDLSLQVQTDSRHREFIDRAIRARVLGYEMMVARMGDVLRGRFWAYSDESRRGSRCLEDPAGILRHVGATPELRNAVPPRIGAFV